MTLYSFDNRNRLTSETTYPSYAGSGSTPTQTISYSYDVFNRLIGRTVTGVSASSQRYVYDLSSPLPPGEGHGVRVLAFDGSGNLTDRYLWGRETDQLLADESFSALTWSQRQNGLPLVAGTTLWALADNQGTVRDVVTDSGALYQHIAYTPFGQQLNGSTYTPQVLFDFGYDGTYTDVITGDQLHGVRWFDPAAQRWVSQDWDGLGPDSNPYRYCGNAPTDGTDPSGMWPITDWKSNTHEDISIEAALRAGYEIWARGFEGEPSDFSVGLRKGVEWTDAPDGLWALLVMEHSSSTYLMHNYPDTYETQLGSRVYRHGMAPHLPDGSLSTQDPKKVKEWIITWIMQQYREALPLCGEKQGEAIGKALHTIEDLYSPAHTVRIPVAKGAIQQFQDYNEQDHDKHENGDTRDYSDETRACYEQAIVMAAQLLKYLRNKADPADVEDWLNGPHGPLVLAPYCVVGGTAPEYAKPLPGGSGGSGSTGDGGVLTFSS